MTTIKKRPLLAYFIFLIVLCTGFVVGMKTLGPQGMILVQGSMLTSAIAALFTRMFFCEVKFNDANLRLGKLGDYVKYWLMGIGMTALSYFLFTLLGSISWDFTGLTFLKNLPGQFAIYDQNIEDTLPLGFTPQMML